MSQRRQTLSTPAAPAATDTAAGPGSPGAQPPEAERWDRLLLAWPRAHPLQSHGMGTVQAAMGWAPRRLEVSLPGRPLLPVQVLVGSPAPHLPCRLYVPKGPACAPDDAEAWAGALAAVERLAAVEQAALVEIEPSAWEDDLEPVRRRLGPGWEPAGATRQPAATAVVDLEGGMEAVLARMRPKGRYNVRLAARRGVECAAVSDPAEAGALLGPLLAATAARQDTHLADAAHVRRVVAAMPSAQALVARVEGEPVAGIVLLTFGAQAVYLYGGSSDRHRDRQPSAALQAFAMERALAAGCSSYDLWGMPPDADPSHPWHGLRQFKLNLGGRDRRSAGAMVRVRRPAAARALEAGDRLREVARGARSRVTARVARRVAARRT